MEEGISEVKHIPVIALTADTMGENIKNALDMGFHSYIIKPIKVSEFLGTIDNILV
ncbi:MAG: hypothetical protein QF607_03325 [Nitrospinaceae bacterium]|nr:hypothetical protein [Nitrospinaceae bacterium]